MEVMAEVMAVDTDTEEEATVAMTKATEAAVAADTEEATVKTPLHNSIFNNTV